MEDYSHLSDYEDSTKGLSYPMYLGNLMLTSFGDDDYGENKTLPFSLSSSEKGLDTVCSINKFLPSRRSHLLRPIIPIGPRFQAEVSKWGGEIGLKHFNGDNNLK
ncbi:unnamed protein product [Vicia faba]|uniref:Uncharacterized protein n=1 Tax=Vicia faba TaxID=3906 RepID=A0AAV1AQP1_VICFA|nr:unnamed protein product [Vicia faba]